MTWEGWKSAITSSSFGNCSFRTLAISDFEDTTTPLGTFTPNLLINAAPWTLKTRRNPNQHPIPFLQINLKLIYDIPGLHSPIWIILSLLNWFPQWQPNGMQDTILRIFTNTRSLHLGKSLQSRPHIAKKNHIEAIATTMREVVMPTRKRLVNWISLLPFSIMGYQMWHHDIGGLVTHQGRGLKDRFSLETCKPQFCAKFTTQVHIQVRKLPERPHMHATVATRCDRTTYKV